MSVRHVIPAIVLAALLPAVPAIPAAETFTIDNNHSDVSFKIRHLVSNVTGRFRDFSGAISLDVENPAASSVSLTIKAASIDTAVQRRDDHLKSPDFFDAAKFPELTFSSTKIRKTGATTYEVTGNFTLHGVTREIAIPVEFLGVLKGPGGSDRAGFSTSFPLDRKDYGIVWNKLLDAGGTMLGNEVTASINIEAVRSAPKETPAAK